MLLTALPRSCGAEPLDQLGTRADWITTLLPRDKVPLVEPRVTLEPAKFTVALVSELSIDENVPVVAVKPRLLSHRGGATDVNDRRGDAGVFLGGNAGGRCPNP